MNVPIMSKAVQRHQEIDVDDVDEEDGEMLPPHEIVARSLAQSPMLSCSVLEGAGRTLKGRIFDKFATRFGDEQVFLIKELNWCNYFWRTDLVTSSFDNSLSCYCLVHFDHYLCRSFYKC